MAEESSPDASNSPTAEPTTASRRRKRSYIAYLHRLQNNRDAEGPQADHDDSIHVGADEPSMVQESRASSQGAPPVDPDPDPDFGLNVEADMSRVDPHISNPIHEPDRLFALDQASRQQFVGESTCLAFGDRILQCLNPQPTTTPLPASHQYVHNPVFARQLNSVASCKFPERIRANLLVRVALRFIGQDYHLFLHHDFLNKFDEAYGSRQSPEYDSVWISAKEARPSSVPGTGYFLTAVGLLQDLFEEPSIAQIETLLLFCFYSNVLGRVKSAHMYSGMAVRSSTCLGLHRSLPDTSILSPIEREHRTRLWWTVYIFDRSTCSKLGQPLTIQDADIDVGMPSLDILIPESQTRLGSPDHLIAYINLAQITGFIMRDIYAPASKANGGRLVQNVRTILQKLRKWDAHVPARLRWNPEGGVPRSVASLQLHFNQCIILTTRPILLHIFKIRNPFASHTATTSGGTNPPQLSDTTKSLADSCVAAARTSNTILSQLFVENALATCGYFDAHHLFASTLVLIISAISSPNSSDSDAVQTAFQLLMVMRDNGNAAAGEYFSRLLQIQWAVSRLFTQATTTEETTPAMDAPSGTTGNVTAPNPPSGLAELDDYDWSKFVIPTSLYTTYDETAGMGTISADPLDNPLLQAFLDHTDGSREENTIFNTEDVDFML
ncbi:hypothetical protein QQX98_004101 [Neonectria punicea]|uniref:Xylanolytic transcriptional activator regulatory domain-containing protein n=1 Tax=Neonectria punicea TaxID=979145 RepID=A0ABR1HC58_9HYPO